MSYIPVSYTDTISSLVYIDINNSNYSDPCRGHNNYAHTVIVLCSTMQ